LPIDDRDIDDRHSFFQPLTQILEQRMPSVFVQISVHPDQCLSKLFLGSQNLRCFTVKDHTPKFVLRTQARVARI